MRKFCKEISLSFLNPEVAKDWDYEKNYPLIPENMYASSNKKVWWKCNKNHSYFMIIQSRTSKNKNSNVGDGCPYCSGHKACNDNCLETKNPELIQEWHPTKNHPLSPSDVTCGSHKKIWWLCKNGHEYQTEVKSRVNGTGCIYCAGLKLYSENCLATVNPELAKEWHPTKNEKLTPSGITIHNSKKVWWLCKNGHSYSASPANRHNDNGCPYCSGHKVCEDNCLENINPKLLEEWNYKKNIDISPKNITSHSGKKVWWKCKICGYEYIKSVAEKSTYNDYCFNCESLLLKNPDIIDEWHPTKNGTLTPSDVNANSKTKVWWKCRYCGYEFLNTVHRHSNHRVCKNCMSLLYKNPKLAKEWHPTKNGSLTPDKISANNNKKVWWICKNGHEFKSNIHYRNNGVGCPYCANQKVCIDNCLATKSPHLIKEWHPTKNGNLTPFDVISGSNKKAWWLCKNKHESYSSISARNNGCGCPYCNKIELKDGTICDSLSEAYIYLELKNKNIPFNHQVKINLGKCSCDFYITSENKYIEVTGYNKTWKRWRIYLRKIVKKKHHVIKSLKANFEFIQITLTPDQIKYVRENCI